MRLIEKIFEKILWSSRVIVLISVLSSLALAIFIFYFATADVINIIYSYFTSYTSSLDVETKKSLKTDIVIGIIKVIDIYLIGIFMLIFSYGLYELFISKIDAAENSETSQNILLIKSFDDLKTRLGNVVLLILVVNFFQHAVEITYTDSLSLMYLGIGILVISGAIYLSFLKGHTHIDHSKK
jgi:uncharacterized membrane protein YqhA